MNWRGDNAEVTGDVTSGRLSGYTRAISELNGGMAGAVQVFERLADRRPKRNPKSRAPSDRFVDRDRELEVWFRTTSRSGGPVLEIIDHREETYEKVHF